SSVSRSVLGWAVGFRIATPRPVPVRAEVRATARPLPAPPRPRDRIAIRPRETRIRSRHRRTRCDAGPESPPAASGLRKPPRYIADDRTHTYRTSAPDLVRTEG